MRTGLIWRRGCGHAFLFQLILLLAILLARLAEAGTVTAASGGSTISVDTAASGGSGAWTTLVGPIYAETANGDLNNGTVILTAPAGFQFNTAAAVTVRLLTGDNNAPKNINNVAVGANIAASATAAFSITATTISFTIFSKSQGNTLNSLQWTGIQVRPTATAPLATGTITASGTSGIAVVASSTNFGTLTEVPGTMVKLLTLLPGQTFTAGSGITGTATAQAAGTAFQISELIATDQFFNVTTSYTGSKTIAYSGPTSCLIAPAYTTAVSFNNGRSTTALATTLSKAETTTITASDSSVSVTGPASSNLTVTVGAVSKLVVTLPGETFTACSGNSGTPSSQAAGVAFAISSITATDANFNIVTGFSGARTVAYSGPSGSPSYTTAVNFTSGVSTTTLTTTLTVGETTQITASNGGVSGPASSSFTVTAPSGPSNFNAFDSGTAAGTTTGGLLQTKVSGTSFAFHVVALTAAPAVMSSFAGTVKVELVDATAGSCSTMTTIQTLANQTFAVADNGRHAVSGVVEANAWKNARVRISYPATGTASVIACSSDAFAIRPSSFTLVVSDLNSSTAGTTRILNNIGAGFVHKAGQPFTITLTPRNSAGVTTSNYTGTPVFTASACTGSSYCLATPGTLTLGSWTNTAGVLSSSTASYHDIGSFTLVAEDQAFAVVDAADSSAAQRYISSATVPSLNVGRFVPDHFKVSLPVVTPRPGCVAPGFAYLSEPFQATFTLTAENAIIIPGSVPATATLSNYAGSLATLNPSQSQYLNIAGFNDATIKKAFAASLSAVTRANPGVVTTTSAHGLSSGNSVQIYGVSGMTDLNDNTYTVTVIDSTRFSLGVNTSAYANYVAGGTASRIALISSSGAWTGGVAQVTASLRLLRSAAPDGPFTKVRVGIAPVDNDGVTANSTVWIDTDQNGTGDRVPLDDNAVGSGIEMRFGILRLSNAYGSERLGLPIPMSLAYWNGSAFVTNTLDSCTSFSSANITFSNYRGGISAGNMGSANLVQGGVNAGVGSLKLSKPSPQPAAKGSVTLTFNLAAENKTWLRGRWAGSSYDVDPSANAAFGLYRNEGIIYFREIY